MHHSIRSNMQHHHRTLRMPNPAAAPPTDGPSPPGERAILVRVLLPESQVDQNDPLGELRQLAESAGVQVVDCLMQKRMKLSTGHALGTGKLEELAQRVHDGLAEVVIFDNDLHPRQIRGLEKVLQVRVIDRTELILDIFAARARTREAQLQVELAQLEYTAPRLRGLWTHLERLAGAGGGTAAGAIGGVGTRGPGERQLEIDRRLVRRRISHLRTQIEEIDGRRRQEVRSRGDEFTVSLVGYTNSGKSTLMNRLTGADRLAADRLFATLDTKTVRWSLGEGRTVLLSDTVGFIRDLPHTLVASFRATLEEAIHANLLLHVADASSPTVLHQIESVEQVLTELGSQRIPRLLLLNKMDRATDRSMVDLLQRARSDVYCISALTGEGLETLHAEVSRRMQGVAPEVTLCIPHDQGKAIAEFMRLGQVQRRRDQDEGVELDLRIGKGLLLQLRGRYPTIRLLTPLDESGEDPST